MDEKVTYIETLEGPKPIYEVNKKSLGKISSKLGGLFGHREEDGKIIVRPINGRVAGYMRLLIGAKQLTYLKDE